MADNQRNPRGRRKARSARKRTPSTQEAQGATAPVEGVAEPGESEQRPEGGASVASTEPGESGQRPEEEFQAMAEEHIHNTSNGGTPSPGEKEPSITPVTEKPVALRRKISQYVVSVDDATGAIVRIETLDEKTGQSREFTQEEYAAAYGFASYVAPYYAAYTASLYDPLSSSVVQAYLKGISDYLKTFSAGR